MIEILEAKVIVDFNDLNLDIRWVCSSDLMSDVLYYCSDIGAPADTILITGLVQPQIVLTAEIVKIKVIGIVGNKMPMEKTIELGREKRIPLIVTHFPMFTACGKLYMEGLKSWCER